MPDQRVRMELVRQHNSELPSREGLLARVTVKTGTLGNGGAAIPLLQDLP